MKQEELIKSCSDLLYKLCDLVESRNALSYYDINISSEYFFIPLLNQVFDCNLKNLNTEEKNAAAIDLYDTNGKIAIQVTSDSSAEKIHNTLEKYCKNKFYEKYARIIVIVIVRSHTYRADFTQDTDGKFTFSKSDDIFTIESLIKAISALDIEKIESIQNYLEYQLDTLLDRTQVLTIEQSFTYISQNTKNILNESFFEIDDETFLSDFKKKLDTSNIIYVSSFSIEEGKYCILNLLHKERPDIPIYIIKSKDTWLKAERYLSGCILIPEFQADEIHAIKDNTTIFIQSADYNKNAIRLPRRTIRFLSNKLRENGYDDPYKLLKKTQGLYYYIKSELFTGTLSLPKWEKDNDKSVITAALLGKWTECDGDKAIIEQLYGDTYDQFILYLNQYMDIEDAFIIRKRNSAYNVIYELADPFLSVYSHKSAVKLHIINTFFDLAKSIIADRDPLFDEPFEKHYYLSAITKSKYSNALKTGIIRTLLLLALYADYQDIVSRFVRELLSQITSVQDWAYISQFIELLCEAAPDAVVDCLENNIDNHTGFLDFFTVENSDFIMRQHYYTDFLWCLELLLPCKEYVVRVIRVLLALGDKIDKCSTGNNPRDDISKIFCVWYNVSALSIDEKIELAKLGVEKYPYFWDILYNEIDNNNSVFSNSSFIYRETDEITQYTLNNIFHFNISYTKILLSHVGDCIEKLIKLSKLLPKCTDELFAEIQDKILNTITELCDSDKEQIKTALRKIIYHHRHFANSKCDASSERIEKIKEICLGISFDDPAYDFLYLTGSSEIPIFNPIAFDSKDYYQNNIAAIEDTVASEIKRLKTSGVDLAHFLGLRKIESNNSIGKFIAKYYSDSKYDENILNIIISSTDNPQIAVNYVGNCSDSNLTEIYKAIEYLRKEHYADKFFVAFISVLPFDEKSKSFIQELPDEAVQNYWEHFQKFRFNSKDLLNEAIENMLRFSNWNELFFVTHEQVTMLNVEEILTIISDSTKKIIEERHQINSDESYHIEQILSIVYQRIGNDFESYPILFELEMSLYSVIGWDNMKCCQYLFKRNALLYADILSLIYKKDDGNSYDKLDSDKFRHFYTLERDIKFCPGEENGSINKDIFNEWIVLFNSRLEDHGQSYLFYIKLGKLFACSPTGSDGFFPHEIIREKIEELGNDELIRAFAVSIINGRGIYMVTDGKSEYKLAQKYGELSNKFAIRYPKTSKIFSIIRTSYLRESKNERQLAENQIF